jgi:pimeloyl-ACP methyl ester carboxylesterase
MPVTTLPRSDPPRSDHVHVGGRRLHVASWGDPADPPVLLLHGMRDHARSWDWVAGALEDRYHVIAPDLRGHGDSDRVDASGYTLAAFVLDLADVVAALEIARFALVGHSLGGAIGLRYAAALPEKVRAFCGIECIELPIVRDQGADPKSYPARLRAWTELERERRLRKPRTYATPEEAMERMRKGQPMLDMATIRHLTLHALTRDPQGGWRWKYDNAARFRAPDDASGHDLDQVLDQISCPTLLCYGEASWIPLPSVARLGRIADHRVRMFPGAGHWLHHEARDAFVTALSSFLSIPTESPVHA